MDQLNSITSHGTVFLYNGKVARYMAYAGQAAYESKRKNSCRRWDYLDKLDFIRYVDKRFLKDHISIGATVGEAFMISFKNALQQDNL